MSRETQYIGLNKYAHDFVKNAIKTETYIMTQGMFGENIEGTIYYMPVPYPELDVNEEYYYKEIVQYEPWSSGPMIFTCLQRTLVKKTQVLTDEKGEESFRWMIDPSIEEEYDYETGRLNL